MAEDIKIVDNSVEMDPTGDDFKKMFASVGQKADKVETKPEPKVEKVEVKTDVKEPVKAESESSSETEPEGDAEETADVLKKQIAGLKAELTKRKGQHDKVADLESQIKTLQAEQAAQKSAGKQTDEQVLAAQIAKLTHDEIVDEQITFQDELADARANLKMAERDGDAEAQKKAGNQILRARKVLKALDKGREELAKRTQDADADEKDVTVKLTGELEDLFKGAYENRPELQDKTSALFKAGDAEYRKRPMLMKAVGQSVGELVSLAYAILRNPELLSGKTPAEAQAVRKDLLKNLDETTSKAFHKGGGATGKTMVTNYAEVAETDLAGFEKLVAKAKGG